MTKRVDKGDGNQVEMGELRKTGKGMGAREFQQIPGSQHEEKVPKYKLYEETDADQKWHKIKVASQMGLGFLFRLILYRIFPNFIKPPSLYRSPQGKQEWSKNFEEIKSKGPDDPQVKSVLRNVFSDICDLKHEWDYIQKN